MICDQCRVNIATVHLSGWRKISAALESADVIYNVEHHFCAECAAVLEKTNPLLNPMLSASPGAERLKLRVKGKTPTHTLIERMSPKGAIGADAQEWAFLTERLPIGYREIGFEFEIYCNESELLRFQGKN